MALFGLFGGDLVAPTRFVHVFACGANGTYWAYERDRGWYEPDAVLLRRIEEVRKTPRILEAPLEEKSNRPEAQQLKP